MKRIYTDPNYRLARILRLRLYHALKGNTKSGSSIKDLGCSIEQLKIHIEKQFKDGMSWNNHDKWHIDHKVPLSFFNLSNRRQLLKACNYKNLQPLWVFDNLSKGAKIYDIKL